MSGKLKPYKLKEVRQLVRDGQWLINPDAAADAFNNFAWRSPEIKRAFLQMSGATYFKTEYHRQFYPIKVDIYKLKDFYKKNVYIHFYVRDRDGVLIVNSFHNLD